MNKKAIACLDIATGLMHYEHAFRRLYPDIRIVLTLDLREGWELSRWKLELYPPNCRDNHFSDEDSDVDALLLRGLRAMEGRKFEESNYLPPLNTEG